MKAETAERDLAFKLLEENSTLGEVAQYLKRKGLHHSAGSWSDLFDKRLSKALEAENLSREDLVSLVRLSEEYGSQHVFLYATSEAHAQAFFDKERVESTLDKMGLASVLTRPRILDQPSSPTIVDVRWETHSDIESFIFKVVERRKYQRFIDQRTQGNFLVRRYRELTVRAVNLFRLGRDGSLELRIYSHDSGSDYRGDISRMWTSADPLFPHREFKEISIAKAKNNLWKNLPALNGVLRYSDSSLRNSKGTVLSAATGSEEDSLYYDMGATRSLDEFLRHKAYCDSSDIWWLKPKDVEGPEVVPSKNIHVLLKGVVNEIVFTAKCSQQDYEYVLAQIRRYNK